MTEPTTIPAGIPTANRTNYWARLGTDITGATTVDEALTRAGMNWDLLVLEEPTATILTDTGVITSRNPGRCDLVRADNGDRMTGDISPGYTPVPNKDAFGVLDVLAATGGATFISGGESDYGRRCHMFLELPEAHVLVGGHDLVQAHLLARTRHDGGGTVSLETRMTRMWCTNGCTARIDGVPQRISIRHTRNAAEKIDMAGDALRAMRRYAKEFAAATEHMLATPMTLGEFKTYVDSLWPAPERLTGQAEKAHTAAMTRWSGRRSALIELYRFADTNEFGRNTAWGAYNTVTEYADWYAETRRGDREDRLAARQMDMAGQDLKDRVFTDLVRA